MTIKRDLGVGSASIEETHYIPFHKHERGRGFP